MNSVVTVEDGTKNWVTVNQQLVSVISNNNTTSVVGSKQGIQGIQGDTAPLTENTPFGGGAFTNGTFISEQTTDLSVGTYDLYTVPAGKRLAIQTIGLTNPTGSAIFFNFSLKVGGVYYRLTTDAGIGTGISGGTNPVFIILEAGETLAVTVTIAATVGLTVFFNGILFDDTAGYKTVKLLGTVSGDNILYTAPTDKKAFVFTSGSWDFSASSAILFVADALASRTVIIYYVPFGGVVSTANRVRSLTTVTALNRAQLSFAFPLSIHSGGSIVLNISTGHADQIAWANILEI